MTEMRQVPLGNSDTVISAIGYGAMHLAFLPDGGDTTAEQVLHAALDLGVTLIDTADRYCHDETDAHWNERQIAFALRSFPDDTSAICVATKGGMLFPSGMWVRYGKPEHIRATIRESHAALGGEHPIRLWQYHQLDQNYPLEETLGAVQRAVDEGLIRHVGVSNFTVEQIDRACQVVDVVSVQNEYSLWWRGAERDGVLEYCDREGLTFFAWRPLGGSQRAARLAQNELVSQLAADKQVTAHQLALAWLTAQSPRVVPIPGSTNVVHLADAVHSLDVTLDEQERRLLATAVAEEPPSLRLHS